MTTKNTGGPAFPHITESGKYVYEEGMTLRDYFAAKAMQALVHTRSPNDAAIEAYEYADVMLKGRVQ